MDLGTPLVFAAVALAQYLSPRTPLVLYVAALSQVLPPLAGIRYRSRLPAARRWTIVWFLALIAGDALQLWLRGSSRSNNLWLTAISSPLQNAIMLWTLSLWQQHPLSRLAFRFAIPVLLVALVVIAATMDATDAFNRFTGPFQALLLLAGALFTLVNNAVRDPEGVTKHDWFWITLGISLYFGLRVALPPFTAILLPTHPELVRLAYFVQAWTDIASSLLIARGILCPLPPARSGGFF